MSDEGGERKRFALKTLLILFPALFLGAMFVAFDPFKVVFEYENYSMVARVPLNREFVSVETFKRNRPRRHYNSFIFGSSRSLAFLTNDWQPYLNPGAAPFHFDAFGEDVYGIRNKVIFVRSQGSAIRNALVLICPDVTLRSTAARPGHLFSPHYELSRKSAILYYGVFFRAFLNPRFLASFLVYKASGRIRPWMDTVIDARDFVLDPWTNDVSRVGEDIEMAEAGEKYWERRAGVFTARPPRPLPYEPQITGEAEPQLREIARAFLEERTDYRIVVSPLYDQRALAASDAAILRTIFGADRVFDYSGVNAVTLEKHNYYERSHFRPTVARRILSEVYGRPFE